MAVSRYGRFAQSLWRWPMKSKKHLCNCGKFNNGALVITVSPRLTSLLHLCLLLRNCTLVLHLVLAPILFSSSLFSRELKIGTIGTRDDITKQILGAGFWSWIAFWFEGRRNHVAVGEGMVIVPDMQWHYDGADVKNMWDIKWLLHMTDWSGVVITSNI